jgi:hypothetical protein
MNRSRHTGRMLRLTGILAGLAAGCAICLACAIVADPVLAPLDQGAPPILPGPIRLS